MAHLPPWPFPPLCPSFGSGPFPLSSSSPTHHLSLLSATSPCSCLFFPRAFLALSFNLRLPICSVKSPGLSGRGQLSGSLRTSPGASPPLFQMLHVRLQLRSWTVSLLSCHRSSEALHSCKATEDSGGASTHLANTNRHLLSCQLILPNAA